MTKTSDFLHGLDYPDAPALTLTEIAETLKAHDDALPLAISALESLYPGLTIEKVDIRLEELTTGSLFEILFVTLFVTFQGELTEEVPPLIEHVTGITVDDRFDSLVTVLLMVALFVAVKGMFATGRLFTRAQLPKEIASQHEKYAEDLAQQLGVSRERVDVAFDAVLRGKNRPKVVRSAARLFGPANKGGSTRIVPRNAREVPVDVVRALSTISMLADLDDENVAQNVEDALLEIRATDRDKPNSGWAGILHMPDGATKRLSVKLYPNIDKEALSASDRARVDAVVECKRQADGGLKPSRIHVMTVINHTGDPVSDGPQVRD